MTKNSIKRFAERVERASSFRLTVLALLSAMIVGAVIIVLSDITSLREGNFGTAFNTVIKAYSALFTGSFGSLRALSNTISSTTPLLLCGVSVAVAFKAGLFNIGATGQMLAGGMASLWVGFSMHGPGVIQVPLAIAAGAVGGALYGAIPGILKARTGAHEVITTIMLNNMAAFLVLWLLKTSLYQREDRTDPISKLVDPAGRLPRMFGFLSDRNDLLAHTGFVVAVLVVIVYWWLLQRSTIGFEFRAFGLNSDAAQYAGMHTKRLMVSAMMIAGAFAGMAGASEVLGTYGYASQNFAGNIGFDAIAIALLGRSQPLGTAFAAVLFGAMQAGGRQMQANTDVPIDLIVVLRALIVMFIAAPLLIKAIWRVKTAQTAEGQTFRGWGG
ncbi:MAG: ABC transporter permease [Ilumatobacteraceae bacterium]